MNSNAPAAPLTPAQQTALALKSRILAGEKVPLDELKEFILLANSNLTSQRKEAQKPSDVDFF